MTAPDAKPVREVPRADGMAIGVISASWNADIVERLAAGALTTIGQAGGQAVTVRCAGAFELPFAARVLARSGLVDAIVVIGAVIRGETTHYELVSNGCATGVMAVQLETGIPIGLGVVTVENHEQALARSDDSHNVGTDATIAAIELALFAARLKPDDKPQ